MLKNILYWLAAAAARAIVKKYRPRVIGITGSVGKTTTKNACVAVLAARWRVRGAAKNYNNELGVPLTIIGGEAPGRNPIKWLRLFGAAARLLFVFDPLYPQILVLEMGADHPGDLKYLMSIAPLDVGVVTAVSAAHTEFFGSIAGVLAEKKIVVTNLSADKIAIVNADDNLLRSIWPEIKARLICFGAASDATVRVRSVETRFNEFGQPNGTKAEIFIDGENLEIFIANTLGRPIVSAVAAAAAVGQVLGLSLNEIERGLAQMQPPPGRLRLLKGIKNSLLIDDTYNASPRAMVAALETLAQIKSVQKQIAVLGDMRELGALTESVHKEMGELVAKLNIAELVTVGAAARFIADGALAAGMSRENIFSFGLPEEAANFLRGRVAPGDLILIKGSQGIRCEKITRALLAEPERAVDLLVRQSADWLV